MKGGFKKKPIGKKGDIMIKYLDYDWSFDGY